MPAMPPGDRADGSILHALRHTIGRERPPMPAVRCVSGWVGSVLHFLRTDVDGVGEGLRRIRTLSPVLRGEGRVRGQRVAILRGSQVASVRPLTATLSPEYRGEG